MTIAIDDATESSATAMAAPTSVAEAEPAPARGMRFLDGFDLSRLPWFELRPGRRLALADRSVGPIVDCHAHLALSYVLPARVDLNRAAPRTEHYLPMERALDLDIYVNRNFSPIDLSRLERDLTLGSLGANGMRATHTLPNLAREMDELGIRASVLLPIDFPVLSANARSWLDASRGRREVVCFGSVHPYAPDPEAELDRQVALGARGIKIHPAVQLVAPDDRRTIRLCRLAGERGLPILFHCGPVGIETRLGRRLSQVRRYRGPIVACPETTFVLGHSGALQMELGLALAKRFPNVWLETSSQSLRNVRRIVEEAPRDRVVYGSDWPFYHQAIALAKVLIATEGDGAARRAVLHDNAARLLGLGRGEA